MADSTVFSDTAVTLRRIDFDNQNRYAIAGTGSVNLAAGSNPKATINVLQGTHEFRLRVNLLSETDVTVASDLTLEFNNRLNLGGNTLNKLGDGTMAVNNILNTDGGTMNVQAGIVSGIGGIGGDLNNQAGTIAPGNAEEIISIVPEPTAAFLVNISIAGLVGYNGRRRKR